MITLSKCVIVRSGGNLHDRSSALNPGCGSERKAPEKPGATTAAALNAAYFVFCRTTLGFVSRCRRAALVVTRILPLSSLSTESTGAFSLISIPLSSSTSPKRSSTRA